MEQPQSTHANKLRQAHVALVKDLGKLQDGAHAPQQQGDLTSPANLAALLQATRAHVAEHFQLEEEQGYMAEVVTEYPHIERTVEQLHQEHRQLLRTLDDLITEVGSVPVLPITIWATIQNWVGAVQAHETRENLLVQDAFNVDLAAED
jgi:hemerythrin